MLSFLMLCLLLVILSVWFIFFILCLTLSQRGSCSPPFCESVRVYVCDFCIVYFWRDLRFVWDFQLKLPEEAGKGKAFFWSNLCHFTKNGIFNFFHRSIGSPYPCNSSLTLYFYIFIAIFLSTAKSILKCLSVCQLMDLTVLNIYNA